MSVNPKAFSREYYYNICLGSEEFKKSGGLELHPKVKRLIESIKLTPNMDVLEIGCGRGDTALYVAKKVNSIVGIDYAPEAIKIAKEIQRRYPQHIQKKSKFFVMDATQLQFKDNSFDLILFIDTLDHLDTKEQEKMFKEVSRVLKDGGELFIRTCSNRISLSQTYKYHIYPLNRLLTWIDKKIKKADYASLPQNPRTKEQEHQHINEPDYFQLKHLFKKFNFVGKIETETGFLKEGTGIRTAFYNFAVAFYPLSKYYPLSIFYASSFFCRLRKQKNPS